ncbi:hypothetical protein OJAV_G00016230 [Oryzias javanicus]|uniref:C2H2-type domain-containing protein n=1 Tax=Oryzias javanicus TaxID=123683 RepID=A0A3S2Q0S1_ORYJA|nr:hypothetical protein OJAV_G00016230 [Oryzias javanicus]
MVTSDSKSSLRELISERLAAAAEEIFRLCERTIVQYEQELCRQRRLLDIWKPQLQLHVIDLPQHYLGNQEKNSLDKQEEQDEPDPPQMKEEQEEPEPSWMRKEQEGFCINQDEEQLELKQETDTLIEISTYEENENSEADLNNYQIFNVTESQEEEGNQHEESSTDEETDPQNRDQRKKTKSMDCSHMSGSLCDIDSEENTYMKTVLMNTCERKKEVKKHSCQECGRSCTTARGLKHHLRIHTGEKPFSCKECSKSFRQKSNLTCHMLTHTGEKPFSCEVCKKSFRKSSHLKCHMSTHKGGEKKGEKPFSFTECNKSFDKSSILTHHIQKHTGQKLFSCKECSRIFRKNSHLTRHMLTHTGEKPFSCTECSKSFRQIYHLKYHMLTHTKQKSLSLSSVTNNSSCPANTSNE